MAQYMLNLVFSSPDQDGQSGLFNGLFNGYNLGNTGSGVSIAWYTVGTIPHNQSLITNTGLQPALAEPLPLAAWPAPQQDKLIATDGVMYPNPLPCNQNDYIYVRVAPDLTWTSIPFVARFICTFARCNISTNRSTPFSQSNKLPMSIISYCPWTYSTSVIQRDSSVIMCLGSISALGLYTFNVNITVNDLTNRNAYDFGHDPQMDVTG
jgi:hypothetical protein